jgi:hypothetical protein
MIRGEGMSKYDSGKVEVTKLDQLRQELAENIAHLTCIDQLGEWPDTPVFIEKVMRDLRRAHDSVFLAFDSGDLLDNSKRIFLDSLQKATTAAFWILYDEEPEEEPVDDEPEPAEVANAQ